MTFTPYPRLLQQAGVSVAFAALPAGSPCFFVQIDGCILIGAEV